MCSVCHTAHALSTVHFSLYPDVPDREEVFVKKAAEFQKHSKSMADTATALAKSGAVTDRKQADNLIRTAAKV